MRRSIFHTILRNLEDIQLVAIEMDEGMDLYSIEVRMGEETRNLMGIVRERAIYIDLSHREEGMLTFAMERNYLEKIKEDVASIDGIRIELVDD